MILSIDNRKSIWDVERCAKYLVEFGLLGVGFETIDVSQGCVAAYGNRVGTKPYKVTCSVSVKLLVTRASRIDRISGEDDKNRDGDLLSMRGRHYTNL